MGHHRGVPAHLVPTADTGGSGHENAGIADLRLGDTPVAAHPLHEAIRAQLTHRGTQIGAEATEAFEVIRHTA
jgi:hypothetical protein